LIRTIQEFERPGPRDRSQVFDQIFAAHPDAVVGDRESPRQAVRLEMDLEFMLRFQLWIRERFEANPVEGVRGVRDQLPKENLLIRVEGVNHQVE